MTAVSVQAASSQIIEPGSDAGQSIMQHTVFRLWIDEEGHSADHCRAGHSVDRGDTDLALRPVIAGCYDVGHEEEDDRQEGDDMQPQPEKENG